MADTSDSYHDIHAQLDRLLLPRLLEEHDYNLSKLSKQLGISRDKLRSRLKELELYSPSRGGRRPK